MKESRHAASDDGDERQSRGVAGSERPERHYHLACTNCGYERTITGDGMTAINRSEEHEYEMASRGVRDHVVEITMLEDAPAAADGELPPPASEPTDWAQLSRRVSARVSSVRRHGGAD